MGNFSVVLWNVNQKNDISVVLTIPLPHQVTAIGFSIDNSKIFCGCLVGKLYTLNWQGEILNMIPAHTGQIIAIEPSDCGNFQYTLGKFKVPSKGFFKEWSIVKDSLKKNFDFGKIKTHAECFLLYNKSRNAIIIGEGMLQKYDLEKKILKNSYSLGFEDNCETAKITKSGSYIMVGTNKGVLLKLAGLSKI